MAKLGQTESEIALQSHDWAEADSNAAWYAIRVRSKSELLVASVLESKGLKCFAPTFGLHKIYRARTKTVQEAAFPGYLFCRFVLSERLRILNAPGVQYIVGTTRVPERIEDSVIVSLQSAFAGGKPLVAVPYLRGGDAVRVIRGPLIGATGSLIRLKGTDQLVISVDILKRSVSVEIEADAVVGVQSYSARAAAR
jgi:transcription antitermination factor NusG